MLGGVGWGVGGGAATKAESGPFVPHGPLLKVFYYLYVVLLLYQMCGIEWPQSILR